MHPRAHFVQGTAEAAAGAALIEGVARHCSWSTKQKEMLGATRGGASSITSADDNRERCRGQLRPLLQGRGAGLDLSYMGITCGDRHVHCEAPL